MEEPEDELATMTEFLRYHNPKIVEYMASMIAKIVYPHGTDVEAATAAAYADLAETWTEGLRRDPEYLAWRREREPDYTPPVDPEPSICAELFPHAQEALTPQEWENLTDEQREEQDRADRQMTRLWRRKLNHTTEDTPY